MKCPNCSTQLLGSMKKCPKCGYDTVSGAVDNDYLNALAESRKPQEFVKMPGLIASSSCKCVYKGKKIKGADITLTDEGVICIDIDITRSGGYAATRAAFGLVGTLVYKSVHDASDDHIEFPVSSILTVTDSEEKFTKGGYCFKFDDGRELDVCLTPYFLDALMGYMGV